MIVAFGLVNTIVYCAALTLVIWVVRFVPRGEKKPSIDSLQELEVGFAVAETVLFRIESLTQNDSRIDL